MKSLRHVQEKPGDALFSLRIEVKQLVSRTDQEHQVVNGIDLAHAILLDRCSTASNAAPKRSRASSSSVAGGPKPNRK